MRAGRVSRKAATSQHRLASGPIFAKRRTKVGTLDNTNHALVPSSFIFRQGKMATHENPTR